MEKGVQWHNSSYGPNSCVAAFRLRGEGQGSELLKGSSAEWKRRVGRGLGRFGSEISLDNKVRQVEFLRTSKSTSSKIGGEKKLLSI